MQGLWQGRGELESLASSDTQPTSAAVSRLVELQAYETHESPSVCSMAQ